MTSTEGDILQRINAKVAAMQERHAIKRLMEREREPKPPPIPTAAQAVSERAKTVGLCGNLQPITNHICVGIEGHTDEHFSGFVARDSRTGIITYGDITARWG